MSTIRPPSLMLLLLVTLLAANHGHSQRDEDKPDRAKAAAALKSVNEEARAAYKAAREHLQNQAGPVVLFDGDDLVFRYGSYRRVTQPTPALYHDLKAIGHVALGLHALLAPYGDGKLDDRRLFVLSRYLDATNRAEKAIALRDLSKTQLARQEKILATCREILTKVIADKAVDLKASLAELRKVVPLLYENNTDATRAQIDGLHRDMLAHKAKLPEADWKRLTVIIQGSQQPRASNLGVQYFARLLGVKGESEQLIYAESIWDEQKALALMGAKVLDRAVGEDVFGERLRMERDLLGDAAKTYLDELFRAKE